MKKILLILSGIIILALVAAVVIPFMYKDKIIAKAKEEINKTINAKVDFGDFDLTILSSFPNLTFSLNDLSVVGVNEFEGDTLTAMKSLELKLNIWDVIGGSRMKIKSVILNQPFINIIVLKDGKANYDITKTDTTQATAGETSSFKLALQSYSINDGSISYDDRSLDFKMALTAVNHKGKGDFTQDLFILSTNTTAEKTNLWYGGVKYLSNVKAKALADLDMDMKNFKFSFKENTLDLNYLTFVINGWLAMPAEDITMDLQWKVKQSDFKNFVSMIPAAYHEESFNKLKAAGKMDMNGFVKGTYNEKSLPGYGLTLNISDGMFQYPELPSSVNNVNVNLNINNPDGVTDHTVIDLKKLHVELGNEPFDVRLRVTTPVSDADIDGMMKGIINLSNVKNYIPMEKGSELSGILKTDLTVKGRYSSIEKNQFDKFNASGTLSVTGMNYKGADYPATRIDNLLLTFNPKNVTLNDFTAQMGNSDIKASGSIDNLIPYYFKSELLKGSFNFNSKLLDLNELMTGMATSSSAPPDTSSLRVIIPPGNINFSLNTSIGKILYDNFSMGNLKGAVILNDGVLDMKNLTFNMLDGSVKMSGKYSTPNPTKPDFSYHLSLSNFDIQRTAQTFNTVKKLAPVAEKTKGKFSSDITVTGQLNNHMQPVYPTLNGEGKLQTQSVSISNFEPLVKVADALKMDEYKQLLIQNVNVSFNIENGRVVVKPFETNLAGANAKIQGSNGLDQTIDYTMNLAIPKNIIPAAAQTVFSNAFSKINSVAGSHIQLPDPVKVNLLIGGTVTAPTVKTDFSTNPKAITETIKEQVKETVKEKVEEVIKQVTDEAAKLMAEAQQQAQQIRNAAKVAADKIKQEGYAQADNLVKQATNPIAKIAAQKAADKLKKETDAKAQKIIDEGNAKADAVLDAAKKQSDKLLK